MTKVVSLVLALAIAYGGALPQQKPYQPMPLKIELTEIRTSGTAEVTVSSVGEPVRIWVEDAGYWGFGLWRVLVLKDHEVLTYYPRHRFSISNAPVYSEIPASGHLVRKLDLNDGNWCISTVCGSPDKRGIDGKPVELQPGDKIVVVYDVPLTKETVEYKVWYGVVASSAKVQ